MITKQEIQVLRELAKLYAEIAALPIHKEKAKLWTEHNEFRSARPMILIDQICWWEIDCDEWFRLQVQEPYWRDVELELRRKIYCWRNFPVDMVFTPYVCLPKPIHDSGWGIASHEDVKKLEERTGAASRLYHNILQDEADIEKIQIPEITLDVNKLQQIRQEADVIFDGIIPYKMTGCSIHLGIWDTISTLMGVENCYMEILDRPEFIHAILEKMTQGVIHRIECINRLGVFDVTSNLVHCSHSYLDNLPGADADLSFGQTKDGWAFGLAQLFSSCSPAVTEAFEVPYMQRIFPYFGAIYYGCCERLDDRLDVLAKLPNVRKISCSPWSDKARFAENLPEWKVMSVKPTPALLAGNFYDEDNIRKDLRESMDIAKRYNRNVELILKDISTVSRDPNRLRRWAQIAMEEAQR